MADSNIKFNSILHSTTVKLRVVAGSMSAGIVVVKQQAWSSTSWAVLAPLPEDLGQAVVDIPIRVDCLPVLKRYGGHMAQFREEVRHNLFCNTYQSLEFHRWGLTWEDPDCCFFSRIVLKDPRFVASYNVPDWDTTRLSSVKFLQHMCAPIDPTSFLLFSQVERDPMGATFWHRDDYGEFGSHFLMKCPVHLVSLHELFWGFLDQRLCFNYIFNNNSCYRATTTVVVFQ